MKYSLTLILLVFCTTGSFAQKLLPEIKKETVMQVTATVNGNDFPIELSIKSLADPLSIGWSVSGYGNGSFEMTRKALAEGTQMTKGGRPKLGVTPLDDTETFALISIRAYKTLKETGSLTYGAINFKVSKDKDPFKINDKEIDVTHVISEGGGTELWILNRPDLPMLMRTMGMETDITVTSIK